MPTASPIRFRCFRCQKLLGVSPSKSGSVVACPQCAAELIVPEPEPGADEPGPLLSPPPSRTPEPDPRPSASRVEPAVVPWDAPPPPEAAFPPIRTEPLSLRPDRPARTRPAKPAKGERPGVDADDALSAANVLIGPAGELILASTGAVSRPPPGVAPPISEGSVRTDEATSLRDDGPPTLGLRRDRAARRDDVTLPRTAVLLWSFLVLMAVVLAFAAGLLAGRFVWASRARVATATSGRTPPDSLAAIDKAIASARDPEYN